MCLVVGIDQIMVVLIDLDRCQLSLVNNILVRQRAEVEPVVETNGVCGTLSQDIKLSLKQPFVKLLRLCYFRGIFSTVSGG